MCELYGILEKKGSDKMKIIWVRHAEANNNDPNTRERELTEGGMEKAIALAKYYKERKIDKMYSSPYTRAMQTLLPLSISKGMKIHVKEDLREREADFSILKNFKEYMSMQWNDENYQTHNTESLDNVRNRFLGVVEEILESEEEVILIGTHSVGLLALLKWYDPSFSEERMFYYLEQLPFMVEMNFNDRILDSYQIYQL